MEHNETAKIRNPDPRKDKEAPVQDPPVDKEESDDEKRMILSGAEEAGYHAPTREDLNDIRKDHNASTSGVSADEAVRQMSGTAEIPADDEGVERGEKDESAA